MNASLEENGGFPCEDSYSATAENFNSQLKLAGDLGDDGVIAKEDKEEEEEFSFACGANTSPVAAEDAFLNGQIKPFFPLLKRETNTLHEDLPVRKVFVETEGNDDISGKAVEASPEVCKKSNSTGFSKIWRFKDFLGRCNSDGRDAFVFLNKNVDTASTTGSGKKGTTTKLNKTHKSKTKSGSAHEVYLKSKTKEEVRRRSYLPYRPELMGFFTSVSGGGLTKNVHPF